MLGIMLGAIVAEHQLEGFRALKSGLAAAVAAKNGTVSRSGYTPAQRVYGHDVRFPGLTDEEDRLSFAEALGGEGEVAGSHRMRLTARMALLRQDVHEKLRRAVLRRPRGEQGPYLPGTQIYFWTPRKAQRRYVPRVAWSSYGPGS